MTSMLSSMADESSDVEVVYEEVSLQSKLRQELHMLEILRNSQEPIPVNYSAFKEHVARLKYTFCQEVIDSVWNKLKEIMTLEKEGKLGNHFNRRSLCGRNNCVCGKELHIIEVTSSENESDFQHSNKHSTTDVQKASVYETSILNTNLARACSQAQYELDTASSNDNNKCMDKNSTDSTEVYSKSYRENVTKYKEEIETHKKKTNRSKKKSVTVSESDSHTELPSKHNKSSSKDNSEFIETVDYTSRKRRSCENSRTEEYRGEVKETHTSDERTYSNNEVVDTIEVSTDSDSDVSFSVKKKKQRKESARKSTDTEDDIYKKNNYNKKHKGKVKAQSKIENLSGITKRMCELIENDMKTEEDNCGKISIKTDSRHKKRRSHFYSNTECMRNDREQSVIIDAHIQIVQSSKNGEKSKSSNNSISSSETDNTNIKKTENHNDEKHNRRSNSFNKEKLKKFFKIENKKRRKENEKIVNREWQLIHDRFVQLMVPKIFNGEVDSNGS